MKRRITRGIAITVTATLATLLLSAAPARADHWYGPYSDEATCNYWRYAVQASGQPTRRCYHDIYYQWFFAAY